MLNLEKRLIALLAALWVVLLVISFELAVLHATIADNRSLQLEVLKIIHKLELVEDARPRT